MAQNDQATDQPLSKQYENVRDGFFSQTNVFCFCLEECFFHILAVQPYYISAGISFLGALMLMSLCNFLSDEQTCH